MHLRYGKQTETKTIDDNGSTIKEVKNIVDYKTISPVRMQYSIREKVKSKKDELTEYLKFSDSLDDSKLDPAFNIERTTHGSQNGYYFVVKSWTELVY